MTEAQKAAIIGMFNAALEEELRAEAGMDQARSDRAWSNCATAHSFALGRQSAIDATLEAMGYTLVKDDEDCAVDIETAERPIQER